MRVPRKVYAIYPFTEYGEIAGVYVGSSYHASHRIREHFLNKGKNAHTEFHELMRRNGFAWQELDDIPTFFDKHKEFDWIAFFRKQNVRVFNTKLGIDADQTKIYRNGNAPIWTGEKVDWGNE